MFFYSTSSKIYNIIYPSVYQLRFPFFLCHHSFYPMSSINHSKNMGQKTVFFSPIFGPNFILKPLYVVVEPYYFPSEPQYVIRIILSTCLSLSHKSSCTFSPSLYTGKLKEIAFNGTSVSPRGYI